MAKKIQPGFPKKLIFVFCIAVVLLVVIYLKKTAQKENRLLPNQPEQTESAGSALISREEALNKVKLLPDVIEYLKEVPNGIVTVNGEDETAYMIQVYEIKDGHTATFNWFTVNKKTGEVTSEF